MYVLTTGIVPLSAISSIELAFRDVGGFGAQMACKLVIMRP